MYNDLIFIENNLINICDMSNFLIDKKSLKKEIIGVDRFIIEIPITELKTILNNKGINYDSIKYNLKCYLEKIDSDLSNNEYFYDETTLIKIKNFFRNYETLDIWYKELTNLIKNRARPENFIFFINDYSFEELLFKDFTPNNELQEFLLNLYSEWNLNNYSDSLYNIPFLTNDELLFMLINDKTDGNIKIDITDRLESAKLKAELNSYKQQTFYLYRFNKEFDEIIKNIDNYKNDKLIKKLFISHLITLFESYLKNIIRLAVNNKNIYLKLLCENDTRINNKNHKIQYKDLFIEIYKEILENRHLIIHNNGYYPN
ncbi:hypothetical protein, partial [Clostridium baratii]|uniref:hypothetical protein n=1 Tax=Clostridium baratii TaxID=1561 RepID=UPI0006DD2027